MVTAPFRIAVPRAVEVSTALEPVYNNLTSLSLLNMAERLSTATTWVAQTTGDGPENRRANRLVWIPETVAALTAEERHRNRLVFEALGEALITEQDWPDFAAYLDDLAGQEAVVLRDKMLAYMLRHLPYRANPSTLLADADAYINAVETLYPGEPIDRELQIEAHTLLNDPAGMQQLIVTHLREMWSTRLADEWKRNSTLLASLVTMLRRRGLPTGSAAEVMRAFVGRDLPSNSSLLLADVEQIIFVPSAHVGLYASKFGTEHTLWVFVNTTVILGWTLRQAPVSRPELLTRLSTLADETRLRILELLAQQDELYAQEIMAQLELTQSSASRHLNQLRSLGFIVERRGEGASKLYQLNRPQFDWTFRAIEQLLAGESVALGQLVQPDQPDEIRNFLDRNGRVESWPAKRKAQQVLLRYLVERFEPGQRYSEREVNAVLNEWHTFDDPATLRRDMYDERLLDRTRDGMQYWRVTESTSS